MFSSQTQSHTSFSDVLESCGRSNELTEKEDIYGWLIGSWEATVHYYAADGTATESSGEWHIARVLEGRAIQDVWIVPPRSQRSNSLSTQNNRYGTTLRIYDQQLGAWHVNWFNPVTGVHEQLIGRRIGENIVQDWQDAEDNRLRWVFTDITGNAFRWYGERSHDGGKTWWLKAEFRARRMK